MAQVIRRTTTFFSPAGFLALLLNVVGALVFSLLGLRFIFKLLAANPNASLVEWVYQTSFPLVNPFQGIFPSPNIDGGFVLDLTVLLAILIYGIVFYVIQNLIEGMEETRTKKVESIHHDHDDM